ncbi:MAG: DUF1361 domain-containing protein [Candidatus Saccharimonadales bacterium]
MRKVIGSGSRRILLTLGVISLASLGFFAVSALYHQTTADSYLVWNLALAWLPLVFAGGLLVVLKNWPWLSWRPLAATVLWLAFLPNSFYLISDLVHLQSVAAANVLYDSVMFEMFIINGLLLGYLSLHIVHGQLLRRIRPRTANALIGLSLFLTSFAIYLGRVQRANSWNLLTNPARTLFDISNPIIDPRHHADAFGLTLTFFVMLVVLYFASRRLVVLLGLLARADR